MRPSDCWDHLFGSTQFRIWVNPMMIATKASRGQEQQQNCHWWRGVRPTLGRKTLSDGASYFSAPSLLDRPPSAAAPGRGALRGTEAQVAAAEAAHGTLGDCGTSDALTAPVEGAFHTRLSSNKAPGTELRLSAAICCVFAMGCSNSAGMNGRPLFSSFHCRQ